MLGRLYRFMTEEQLFREGFDFGSPGPIAFFPGTFDPFTLSHKGIVRAIRDAGFEVLLAIDEFSWSKRTQPTVSAAASRPCLWPTSSTSTSSPRIFR